MLCPDERQLLLEISNSTNLLCSFDIVKIVTRSNQYTLLFYDLLDLWETDGSLIFWAVEKEANGNVCLETN